MKEDDKTRFKIAMHMYEITFNAEFDKAKLAGYFMALEDLDIDAVELAVRETIKTEKRTPPPAVIREYAYKHYTRPNQARLPNYTLADIKPSTELGKACMANICALFDGGVGKREYLLEAARIADKFNQPEIEKWVSAEWAAAYGEA